MKSILYVGATLMIGASIYGFVDYKKTIHKKEFQQMYNDKEDKPVVGTDKTKPASLNQPGDNKIAIKTIDKEKKETIADQPIKEEKVSVNKKPETVTKKKLSYKLFSRAPLERKYLEKDIKIEDLKIGEPIKLQKDSLKENKEQ